jgi:hypothetical protein
VLIAEIFPEQFQPMGRRTNRIGATVQVVKEFEVSKDWLHWGMIIVKNYPSRRIISETDTLYLHHLPPFLHLQLGTDIFYNEELQGFLTLRRILYEWCLLEI